MRPILLAFLLLCGCEASTKKRQPAAEPDRDTTAAVTRVRAIPGVSARLRPDSQLVPATLGVKLDTPLKGGLDTIVPLTARASMRIQRDALILDISGEHANDTKGLIDTGAMVFVQPTPDVDVLIISEPTKVTELRVLRSASAKSTATWTVHRSEGLGPLRVVGSTIEVPRANGATWLVSDAIEVVDSAGTKRPVTLRIDANRITATYDPGGLHFPAALALAWNEKAPQ